MTNQTILITGSSSGLGNQIARALLEKGHTVIATMRSTSTKNAAAAAELSRHADANSGTVHVYDMDVTDEASVKSAVDSALAEVGHIDVLVNNAGVGGSGFTEAYTTDQFQLTFDVNVIGVQRVMRAVLPSMRKRGSGLIINVSSAMGRMVIPFSGAYTASKFAVEGLSESYAYELAGTGVDITILQPGGFATNYWSSMMKAGDAERTRTYGDSAAMPDQVWDGVANMVSGSEDADPQAIADAVMGLMDAESGKRPLRLVVDPVTGGDAPKAINASTAQIQRQLLEGFGMGGMLPAED
ncbi:MAG: SDR family oxidoreductase [Chloroflexota bacterium]